MRVMEILGSYNGMEYEFIDECEESEVDYLLGEYKLAYGRGWSFIVKEVKERGE